MIEVRFHGRGGQGAVTAANILASACFREGNFVQSFPYFGVERRGAPVTAFTRVSDKSITTKSQIYKPDYVVVLDQGLLYATDVTEGLKEKGTVLINTSKKIEELGLGKISVATVNATEIALKYGLGSKISPIVNTAIVGAFAKVSKIVKIENIVNTVREMAPSKKEENANAAKEAYEKVIF